ncbi:MAG: BMP family ABC transporter substrate-binding protein [Spirochaetales bacterium]|nr:BMP family ABC transporter substrate-binding protein [Spirochaetales bacterium]
MNRSKTVAACLLVLCIFVTITGCSNKKEPEQSTKNTSTDLVSPSFKVAFIYPEVPEDWGWTYENDKARIAIEDYFGNKIETAYAENVPSGPNTARIIKYFVENNYNMIFTCSPEYMASTKEVAKDFPDVYFENYEGDKTANNISTYSERIYQARYLSGIVAGMQTETNIIGYIGGFTTAEEVRGLNAFTIGVQKVNPDAVVKAVWIKTLKDSEKELKAANKLLDTGADIITQNQKTTEALKAAKEKGAWSIGLYSDMRKLVGDSVLVSVMWAPSEYYIPTVKAAMNGTWEKHSYWGGIKEGIVKLSNFSPAVSEEIKKKVAEESAMLESGEWDVFDGPIYKQNGKIIIKKDSSPTEQQLHSMNWLVKGIENL